MTVCVCVCVGSLSQAAGVCAAGAVLRNAAPAGGGAPVRVRRVCVRALHQTTAPSRQLPGQDTHTHTVMPGSQACQITESHTGFNVKQYDFI